MNNNNNSGKTFPASDKVKVERVSFKNRYDITVVADMYYPKDLDSLKKYPALVVGPPFTAVKEQTSGLYAQKMAERGFVTLAFDPSYNGESGGNPHYINSPETFVEDYSASVDYIGTRPFVDRKRIGAIGVCAGGAFAVSATAIDHRIKAIATVSMYDMGRQRRQGFLDALSYEDRMKLLDEVGEQRWKDFETGKVRYGYGTPPSVDSTTPAPVREFYDYYRTSRGETPNYTSMMSFTSTAPLMNFFPFVQIETISPRAILFVVGEKASSKYFSDDAFKLAAQPKELYVVPGAGHVDLYDRLEYIPFDKLTSFFTDNLK